MTLSGSGLHLLHWAAWASPRPPGPLTEDIGTNRHKLTQTNKPCQNKQRNLINETKQSHQASGHQQTTVIRLALQTSLALSRPNQLALTGWLLSGAGRPCFKVRPFVFAALLGQQSPRRPPDSNIAAAANARRQRCQRQTPTQACRRRATTTPAQAHRARPAPATSLPQQACRPPRPGHTQQPPSPARSRQIGHTPAQGPLLPHYQARRRRRQRRQQHRSG